MLLPAALSCAAALAILVRRWRDGLTRISFADEATHVLGGRMLAHGAILYRDFVDTHGPLVFALTWCWGALFGWQHNNSTRWLPLLFGVLAILSVALSAAPRGRLARCCGLLLACGLLSDLWLRQGLYLVSFYPLGGALASIGLSGIVFGACVGRWPGAWHAACAGIAVFLLGALAYSFLPTILLFAAALGWAGLRQPGGSRALAGFLLGALAGTAAIAVFMLRFADLHGYLAYHFAENQFVYSRFIGFSAGGFGRSLLPSLAPAERAQTLGVLCAALSPVLFAIGGGGARGPFVLMLLGVLALNARGAANFQDGSFLWAAATLLALSGAHAVGGMRRRQELAAPCCVAWVLLSLWFLRAAPMLPFNLPAEVVASMPRWPIGDRSDAAFFARIRRWAGPEEAILALPYQPQLYLLADRLPTRGFYAWFPWDQEDSRDPPWFKRRRDLCLALQDTPPVVIVVDQAPFWGHPLAGTVPCLQMILHDRYQEDAAVADIHGRLFVRRDRFGHAP